MINSPQLSASGRPLPDNWLAHIVMIWIGQAFSIFTSYATSFACVWWVTETTNSALMLSLLTICAYLPTGLLSPLGGVFADRFNRKYLMIIADMSVGVISLILALVFALGYSSIWLLMGAVIARSVGMAFHSPAMMASMPLLVPEKQLLGINTLDQLLMGISGVISPACGILLYTTWGLPAPKPTQASCLITPFASAPNHLRPHRRLARAALYTRVIFVAHYSYGAANCLWPHRSPVSASYV